MWNKLSQAAGLAAIESEEQEKSTDKSSDFEHKEQLQQQEILIQQLKDLVRENEKRFQEKSKEYDELSSKFQKFKLQSKAKISHLSSQIKEQEKPKKDDCDFDDTSSSDSSDQSRRGKVLLLKKQLEQVKQQLEKKEEESKKIINVYERKINDLELQLNEKNILISSFASEESNKKESDTVDKSPSKDSNVQEMYAQVVYKDAKIMDLNNQILEHEKKIMDLQEHIKEKDEVLQQRNRAVQLMAEDMSRKGKSVVDELDETREQMKIMQQNFSVVESDWKKELEKYKVQVSELENQIIDFEKKLKNSEVNTKNIEAARYELSVKNAELQKKIVCVQESAAKQCELYNKEIGGEVETLRKSLESEKQHAAELQKALDESNSQSDNKVLKARVKERTKFKALERELNELKKASQQKPEEIVELQQHIAELEEEKGSLQLKMMEIEDQVIQLDKLKEENEALKKVVDERINKVQNLEKRINELQSEQENWETKFTTLQKSYEDLGEKFKIVDKEKSDLQDNFSVIFSSKEEIENSYVCPLDPHPDAVGLYSGGTPGKRSAWLMPDDWHTASLVGLCGGWRHTRMKFCFMHMDPMGKGIVLPTLTVDQVAPHSRFLLISLPNKEMFTKSPFASHKAILGIGGELKSIKRLRFGDLLIETIFDLQTKLFLVAKTFLNSTVTISPHKTLNSCRGVISDTDLLRTPESKMLERFSDQGVIQVSCHIVVYLSADLLPSTSSIEPTMLESKPSIHVLNSPVRLALKDQNKLKDEYNDLQKTYKNVAQDLQNLQDQKVTFEMKNIELEEIRESDERAKKDLLARIEQLEESFSSESRPDIQLEKENWELKDELQVQTDNCVKLEKKISELLTEMESLQEKLTHEQKEYSSEINLLNSKITNININYEQAIKELESRTEECVEKEKMISELKINYSDIQNELTEFCNYVGLKSVNDCKNLFIKKSEEYSNLKSDFEKIIKEKDNLLLNLQDKDEELERYGLKTEKLQSILENRDSELKSFEALIKELKDTIFEKENLLHKMSSDLDEKMRTGKLLTETVEEKSNLLLNAQQLQTDLKQELQTLRESQNMYQEKMKANSSSLLSQITDLETELDSLREELNSKETTINNLNEILSSLKDEKEDILSELKEKEHVIQSKNNMIETLESASKLIQDEMLLLKKECESIKTEISIKDSHIMEFNKKLELLENELKVKEAEFLKLSQELKEARKTLTINEETIQLLQQQNAVLEDEKLHSNLSYTEKDAAHKELLTEKMSLEIEFSKLLEENKSLGLLLEERRKEFDVLDEAICKITDLINTDSNEQDFSPYLSADSKLNKLVQRYFSHLKKMQTDNQNLIDENSKLQNKVEDMQVSINEQQSKLHECNSIIDTSKKQYEEQQNELKVLCDSESTLYNQISELQTSVKNLTEENNSLKSNISSSQEQYLMQISALNSEVTNYQSELEKTNDKIKTFENDNLKLSELQDSVKEYQTKDKTQEKEILSLSENNSILEKNILQLNQQLENSKGRVIQLENEIEQISLKFSEERSVFDKLNQSLESDNNNLKSLLTELKAKVSEFENEKHLNESSASELHLLVSEKEHQVAELKLHLNEQNEKLSNLQSLLDQKLQENEKYKHLMETQIPNLQNCKQHYYMMVKALISSFQIDADVSFLEFEDWKSLSIDEFTVKSKEVVNCIVEHSSEIHFLKLEYHSLEEKLKSLQEENTSLESQYHTLKKCLWNLSSGLQVNLKENDGKLHSILSAFQDKENSIEKLKTKISILREFQNLKANQIQELESEMKLCLEKLELSQNVISETERINKTLMEEKEEINKNSISAAQKYEEVITKMSITLQKVCNENDSFVQLIENKQKELEASYNEVQKLQNLLQSKDDEIFRIMQEQENTGKTLNALHTDLTNAHSSISSLQNEIKQLNKQISDYAEESHIVENSNNVSNGLQVEVERLRQELSSSEEQRNYLQQHIDNANSQLQLLQDEKSNLESTVEQMQHKLNDLIEANFNLTNSLEESKSLIKSNEEKIKNLEEENANNKSLCENLHQELQALKLEKDKREPEEKMNLENKISLLEKNRESLKNTLIKMNKFVSTAEELDIETLSIDAEDESLLELVHDLQTNLIQNRKYSIEETKNLQNYLKEVESRNKELLEELEKAKTTIVPDQKEKFVNKDTDKNKKEVIVMAPGLKGLDTNMLQQTSSALAHSEESFTALENVNKSLKKEVEEYKIKFAKILSKLKLFKDKNEKLDNELLELKNKNSDLEKLKSEYSKNEEKFQFDLNSFKEKNEKLSTELQLVKEQSQQDIFKANDQISQLKERNSILDVECCRIRQELQDYKHSWEQSNVSYELQKEDNERLRRKLQDMNSLSEYLKIKISEFDLKMNQLRIENSHLKQEAGNLREHANMLLSDNDTYQDLIEKLTASKNSLEQKLSSLKEKHNAELKTVQNQYELELKKLGTESKEIGDVSQTKELEKECISLRSKCNELQQCLEKLEQERDIYRRNQNLLEKEKLYLQQQLLEKADKLEKTYKKMEEISNNKTLEDASNKSEIAASEVYQLQAEKENLKMQLSVLMQELNLAKENFEIFKQDSVTKEKYYLDTIQQFQVHLKNNQEQTTSIQIDETNSVNVAKLESELQQAMSSLHKQGLRCEELSLEVSKLLEERNILQWKLQQYVQSNQEVKAEVDSHASASSPELISIKIEPLSSNADVATLHARLMESEKTCQQLRQANEALDRALISERDQKRMIEEELDFAKEHLTEEAKASDEYQILLGEINEPEFLAETNFSISRNVRTHAYKFRRWLRGRRNYVRRMVKSRNYPQLVWQVIYSQFGLAIHQNDHQARRTFVEWTQNEIAVVPDFHKRILFSDEAHFWLNGYVNKQNCRIWSEANPQVYVETPLHPEKLTVWCALWAGGILLQKR
ncbi:uncharacterized protein TNCV_3360712 [Trichonephila clavipes]|nr:uncharacterized protein TNCV_3360712 [Trichonephila clavipes]